MQTRRKKSAALKTYGFGSEESVLRHGVFEETGMG